MLLEIYHLPHKDKVIYQQSKGKVDGKELMHFKSQTIDKAIVPPIDPHGPSVDLIICHPQQKSHYVDIDGDFMNRLTTLVTNSLLDSVKRGQK